MEGMKTHPGEWEWIFANSKRTFNQSIKKNYKLVRKRQTTQREKWAEDMNRKYTKDGLQLASKYMKRCSDIREIQIKTTM